MLRVFKHYIPKALILLALLEALMFFSSVYMGAIARFGWEYHDPSDPHAIQPVWLKAAIFTFVMISAMTACGLYQRHLREGVVGMLLRVAIASLLATVAASLLFYLFPDAVFFGRGIFGIAMLISIATVILFRWGFAHWVNQESLKRNIVVLGTGVKAAMLEQFKRKADRHGFRILGYIQMSDEPVQVPTEKILHLDIPLVDYMQSNDVDEIVVAVDDRRRAFPTEQLLDCKLSGVDVIDLLTFFERQLGRIKLDILHPSWFIFSDGFAHTLARRITKRIFDIAVSSILLIFAAPFMVLAMIVIVIDDPGPIFYGQVRVGDKWKLFRILKFRSMRVDAEKHGAQFATHNDPRITRVGRLLRKTRIDELPQLFTVLKGDMSFVGPRPERPEFVERFSEKIPYYADRHRVKPGLTGWAQICFPYGASDKDAMGKLEYDLYYVKNYSLFLDLLILLQTAEVILWGKGAR
ncbi:MAG: TIGR03013 family XrtA/PEP-CTERM system glycosyltransferase [Pseudomonadota bacterium]